MSRFVFRRLLADQDDRRLHLGVGPTQRRAACGAGGLGMIVTQTDGRPSGVPGVCVACKRSQGVL